MVHNGLRGRVQRYKCKDCGRRFDGGNRRDRAQVITDYIEGKQTLEQLADKYKVSSRTIARDLEGMRYVQKIAKEKHVIIQMDTTYWGRNFGLMVIKDSLRKKILWRKYVTHETLAGYLEGISWLRAQGFRIYGIVCDGMRGLMLALRQYPVQMCQFHQQMIVRRYLAEDPELEASRDLLNLINRITIMDKESFIGAFDEWQSAYLSIKRNMPWLWTFYDYKDRVIPNTNNGLEGIFSDIKSKVRVHSGLTREHRKKLIDEYLSRHY